MDQTDSEPSYTYPNPSFVEDLRRYLVDERGEGHRRLFESMIKVVEIAVLSGALQAAGIHAKSPYLLIAGHVVQIIGGLYIWSLFAAPFRRAKRRTPYRRQLPGALLAMLLSYGVSFSFSATVKAFVDDQIKPAASCSLVPPSNH